MVCWRWCWWWWKSWQAGAARQLKLTKTMNTDTDWSRVLSEVNTAPRPECPRFQSRMQCLGAAASLPLSLLRTALFAVKVVGMVWVCILQTYIVFAWSLNPVCQWLFVWCLRFCCLLLFVCSPQFLHRTSLG